MGKYIIVHHTFRIKFANIFEKDTKYVFYKSMTCRFLFVLGSFKRRYTTFYMATPGRRSNTRTREKKNYKIEQRLVDALVSFVTS